MVLGSRRSAREWRIGASIAERGMGEGIKKHRVGAVSGEGRGVFPLCVAVNGNPERRIEASYMFLSS